ncbi:MAG TPA: peptidylprolyl isomerase [Candidatus Acidoferrum sp.]|jgi:hypothetical protein|nr:peptidylprolyl isomerase [Candidatus Acidoferrum sp.]
MKRFLQEPLLHFVLAGTVLFAIYQWRAQTAAGKPGTEVAAVRISTNDIAWLEETWSRQWQRAPSREELRGLVTDFLKEELLAREARAMGLDENDTIVRRRLAQKLEFLVQDTSRLAEPTEEDLRRYYTANPDRFQTQGRISFTHIFFSPEKRKDAAADAKAALAELSRTDVTPPSQSALSEFGDRLLVESTILDDDEQTVAGQFGKDFAQAVFRLRPGAWQGPIESGYGLHLVRVSELKAPKQREFTEVKAQVLERWRDQRQREDNEKYFAGLLRKYDVVVDQSLKPLIGPLGGPIAAGLNGSRQEGMR